ncbi:MAG: 2-hydroxyacid dehydrogenase [Oligoflexia bacterium]|nr:2-hydroxyacid dehydrogenase [Oligoflexia bacterium]
MKIAFFSTHRFEKSFFAENPPGLSISFFDAALNRQTAPLTQGFDCVCCFVSDQLDSATIEILHRNKIRLIALRSAGYNNVDLAAADRFKIPVVRVPAYSPHAVAEHASALLLSLNRKIHRAFMRVRDLNFSLEGLVGFDLYGKTVGVIGTGRIGSVFARIMKGYGCAVLAYDPIQDEGLIRDSVAKYVGLSELYGQSDIISLHVPLLPQTNHMINKASVAQMRRGALLVNTSRGALINASDLIEALKSGQLAGAALDVYEEEEGIFFKDLSDQILQDDLLARLLTFPNVLITSHQAFLTREALAKIAEITFRNILDFEQGRGLPNQVSAETHLRST